MAATPQACGQRVIPSVTASISPRPAPGSPAATATSSIGTSVAAAMRRAGSGLPPLGGFASWVYADSEDDAAALLCASPACSARLSSPPDSQMPTSPAMLLVACWYRDVSAVR